MHSSPSSLKSSSLTVVYGHDPGEPSIARQCYLLVVQFSVATKRRNCGYSSAGTHTIHILLSDLNASMEWMPSHSTAWAGTYSNITDAHTVSQITSTGTRRVLPSTTMILDLHSRQVLAVTQCDGSGARVPRLRQQYIRLLQLPEFFCRLEFPE